MGIPLLVYRHERIYARLPLRLTLQVNEKVQHLETGGPLFKKKYEQLGRGSLKSIGFDGSVILHASVFTDNMDVCVNNAFNKITEYVRAIVTFFKIYNDHDHDDDSSPSPIILNFVVDGYPIQKKNRRWREPDAYSQMSWSDKRILHERLVQKLSTWAKEEDVKFITNALLPDTERGEGEMALYSLCRSIQEKNNKDGSTIRNVIVSNDSDIVAMMILKSDPTTVIISPAASAVYITNLELISQGLGLDNYQLIQYVIMHFILFGSDYNLGLMTCPTESKQRVILNAIKQNNNNNDNDGIPLPLDIEKVAAQCVRRKPKTTTTTTTTTTNTKADSYYKNSKLKEMLKYEAIMAVFYYASVGDPTPLRHYSPNIYLFDTVAKRKIPFLSFDGNDGNGNLSDILTL